MSSKVKEVVESAVASVENKVTEVAEKVEQFGQNEALNVLVSAVKLAQKRGAYELEEVEMILKAIKVFVQTKV